MPPLVHFVRHSQAYHNLSIANHSIHDPQLTAYGEEQCRTLQASFPKMRDIDLIVSSPLKRTLYTSLITFYPWLQAKQIKVIALPELQETSDLPCDTGSPICDLLKEFAGKPVDFSLVLPGWDSKKGKFAPTAPAIENRAADARAWLLQRPEKEVVVVSHGGFLQYLTSNWSASSDPSTKMQGTGWANAEWRTYTFNPFDTTPPQLIETVQSRQRRLGKYKSLDHNESTQLKRTVTQQSTQSL